MLSKSSRTYLIRVVILKIFASVELDIVQDDRLDALEPSELRMFNYGGFKNRALYDPNIV
jgi:uncharacterized protein